MTQEFAKYIRNKFYLISYHVHTFPKNGCVTGHQITSLQHFYNEISESHLFSPRIYQLIMTIIDNNLFLFKTVNDICTFISNETIDHHNSNAVVRCTYLVVLSTMIFAKEKLFYTHLGIKFTQTLLWNDKYVLCIIFIEICI